MRIICLPLLCSFWLFACNDASHTKEKSTSDSTASVAVADTSDTESDTRCYEDFFMAGETVQNFAQITLVLSGNVEKKLSDFIREELLEQSVKTCLKDLDGDSKKELVIFNYTGGAHCCDEFYVFAEQKPRYYRMQVKLMAGNTCAEPQTNEFTYGFYEHFGYFFTCFACAYTDSARGISLPPDLRLKYKGGKMFIVSDTAALNREVLRQLSDMKTITPSALQQDGDDGFRKTFALHLATWHYCNGRDTRRTKKVFDMYYPFSDAAAVWKEFRTTLADIESSNVFNLQ